MLNRSKHIPLYIQLKEELLQNVKEGIWQIEGQIPTEKELMMEYKVGRATVREALSLLVNEGYLYKKQGIGTFVARKYPSMGFEPLISLTYPLEAMGINHINLILDKKTIVPDKRMLAVMKWKKARPCFYLERMRTKDGIPIAMEESYFDEGFKKYENIYDLTGSLARILVKDLKVTIKKVEQVIVPRVPTDEERDKLKIDDSTLVFDLERWIYIEEDNEPFYYLKFVIPGNFYSLNY
jgi:GntR family transcriptional regulator